MAETYFLCGPSEGTTIPAGPTTTRIKISGQHSNGRVSVIEFEFGPSFRGPPKHIHAYVDHVWYVLAGRVAISVGDVDAELGPGGCAFVPRGTPHTICNAGDEAARVLEVDSPATLEPYFEELGRAFEDGNAFDLTVVASIQARHDTTPLV